MSHFSCSFESLTSKSPREINIDSDGKCSMTVLESVSGVCEGDVQKYPFDKHNCSFRFYLTNVPTNRGNISFQVLQRDLMTINGPWSVAGGCHQLIYFCTHRYFMYL